MRYLTFKIMFRRYWYDVTKLNVLFKHTYGFPTVSVGGLINTLRSFVLQCWLQAGGMQMCLYVL